MMVDNVIAWLYTNSIILPCQTLSSPMITCQRFHYLHRYTVERTLLPPWGWNRSCTASRVSP